MGRFRQLVFGGALAAGLVLSVPAPAGAADSGGCYVGCTPPVVNGSSVNGSAVVPPTTAANPPGVGASSLPFTGADIVELSMVGIAAVLTGGLLARRRRSST